MNGISALAPSGILLLGDSPTPLEWLEDHLDALGLASVTAVDRDQFLLCLQQRCWSALILCASSPAAFSWLTSLLQEASLRSLPLPPTALFLHHGDTSAISCDQLSDVDLITSDLHQVGALRELLSHLLVEPHQANSRCLMIDDGDLPRALLDEIEDSAGGRLLRLAPSEAIDALEVHRPHLLLTSTTSRPQWPLELGRRLRADLSHQWTPWIALAEDSPLYQRQLLLSGADLSLPLHTPAWRLRHHFQRTLGQALASERRCRRDDLTGLWTRRAFIDQLDARLSEAQRHQRPLALAMVDIDRFKCVNDQHGHRAGDQVLQSLATLLLEELRQEDLCGRWGGEEFLIALVDQQIHEATNVLNRLRRQFSSRRFCGRDGDHFQVSFSAGIAVFPDDGDNPQELVNIADRHLFQAKDGGRDTIHTPLMV